MKQNKAIETLEKLYGVYEADSGIDEAIEIAIKAMKERETGEWISKMGRNGQYIYCSACGWKCAASDELPNSYIREYFHYCPTCGSRMVEE